MIKVFNRSLPTRSILFCGMESFLIWLSVTLSLILAPLSGRPPGADGWWSAIHGLVITGIFHLVLYYADLYDFTIFPPDHRHLIRLVRVGGIGLLVFAGISVLLPASAFPAGLRLAVIMGLLSIFLWRAIYSRLLDGVEERILILGTQDVARRVAQEMLKRKGLGFKVVGFLDEDARRLGESLVNPRIIGTYDNLPTIVARERIDRVIIAASERRGRLPIPALLGARAQGVEFMEGTRFYEQVSGKVFLEDIKPSGFIYADGFNRSGFAKWSKRVTGILSSTVILIVTFPVMVLLGIAIKLDSPGPIFFRQERVGEEGRPFMLFKFRSMRHDAEKLTGPVWAEKDDPRVTRIGKVLRTLRLDELPQIINVLKGEMSFVGPRPERPYFVAQLSEQIPFYALRFAVKPGVTGWAQIRYPYGASVEDAREKLRYDLFYIKNMSFFFDLWIIFQTIKIVLFGRGAR
ncbi:MAG: TIGR03013 family PEP-CTERM/XrtA system glycosyltransferase [Nitrospirae bacterium]|nr:TIGR03013 family PEP-CTERM/XrtA system glycosyltransferase [Candidatus Manganitrophaceae bacterium]